MTNAQLHGCAFDGWQCFHCGEIFTTFGAAKDHFGATPDDMAGCLIRVQLGDERGLQMALRKAEAKLAAIADWAVSSALLLDEQNQLNFILRGEYGALFAEPFAILVPASDKYDPTGLEWKTRAETAEARLRAVEAWQKFYGAMLRADYPVAARELEAALK